MNGIKAVKRWRFRPATRLGTAIPMFVAIEMTFSCGALERDALAPVSPV